VDQFLRLWIPVALLAAATCVLMAAGSRSRGWRAPLGWLLSGLAVLAAWPIFDHLHEAMGFDSVAGLLVLVALFATGGWLLGRLTAR
jgi:hypothetical protein